MFFYEEHANKLDQVLENSLNVRNKLNQIKSEGSFSKEEKELLENPSWLAEFHEYHEKVDEMIKKMNKILNCREKKK